MWTLLENRSYIAQDSFIFSIVIVKQRAQFIMQVS